MSGQFNKNIEFFSQFHSKVYRSAANQDKAKKALVISNMYTDFGDNISEEIKSTKRIISEASYEVEDIAVSNE